MIGQHNGVGCGFDQRLKSRLALVQGMLGMFDFGNQGVNSDCRCKTARSSSRCTVLVRYAKAPWVKASRPCGRCWYTRSNDDGKLRLLFV